MRDLRASVLGLSLSRKLIAFGVLTSTVSLLLALTTLVVNDRRSARERLIRDIGMLATVVGANSTAALAFSDRAAATETLRAVDVNLHVVYAGLFDADGRPLATYARSSHLPLPSIDRAALRNGGEVPVDLASEFQNRFTAFCLLLNEHLGDSSPRSSFI